MVPRVPTLYVLVALAIVTLVLFYRNNLEAARFGEVSFEPKDSGQLQSQQQAQKDEGQSQASDQAETQSQSQSQAEVETQTQRGHNQQQDEEQGYLDKQLDTPGLQAANSTLGFGAIFVVSGPGSPRKEGLVQAANVTELDLTIPDLPAWSKEDVDAFRDWDHVDRSKIGDGSIKAWLSHNVVLHEFLRSGLETALIMEDDVDWDIHLRTQQVPRTAAALRSLFPRSGTPDHHYWGDPNDWELLYLGHCGDYFKAVDGRAIGVGVVHPEDLDQIPHAIYEDKTLPDPTDIHPFTASLLTAFNIPSKTRVIYRSRFPLCTFGYAVTRQTAEKLVHTLAPPKETPGEWAHAYDVAILNACKDKDLQCYTVTPELFHHMEGTSLIDGHVDDVSHRPPVDRMGSAQVYYRHETSNINCGFWSQDFKFDGNLDRLEWLREEVGRKGRCLKPGREEDGSKIRGYEAPPPEQKPPQGQQGQGQPQGQQQDHPQVQPQGQQQDHPQVQPQGQPSPKAKNYQGQSLNQGS